MEGRYIVRKWWSEPGSELGRYADGYTAVGECPEGYRIFDEEGTTLLPFEENSYRGLYEQVKKELEELKADGGGEALHLPSDGDGQVGQGAGQEGVHLPVAGSWQQVPCRQDVLQDLVVKVGGKRQSQLFLLHQEGKGGIPGMPLPFQKL